MNLTQVAALALFSVILINLGSTLGYKIGVGRADVTGPPSEVNFMGYANIKQRGSGIHLRLFARAFVIEDDAENVLVFVSADVGMISKGIRDAVLNRVKTFYDGKIKADNLILSATHTHSGPGGYLKDFLFDISCLGYADESFKAIVDGIVRAIDIATDEKKMEKGKIFLSTGKISGVSRNRSPTAYDKNPQDLKDRYDSNVDTTMYQLKFVADKNKRPMGVINWFPIHPTSMNNTNTLISSDNVGYASILFESQMDKTKLPGHSSFVAAFASSNLGDVSPNIEGEQCVGSKEQCDKETSTCKAKKQKCVASGPGEDMFDSTKIIATKLFKGAKRLFDQKTKSTSFKESTYKDNMKEVRGKIVVKHEEIDMTKQEVTIPDEHGVDQQVKGCSPAMGYSFAAGTSDGPGAFDFIQGTLVEKDFWKFLRNLIKEPTPETIACHQPKPILLAAGDMQSPYDWLPKTVSTQIAIIGDVVIAALPGEFTTMAGRQMREKLENDPDAFTKLGGKPTVILAGLSNTYSDYITTLDEYKVQRYEGASTIYGPNTLVIYLQQYTKLLQDALNNNPSSRSLSLNDLPIKKVRSLLPPVILDLPESKRQFGDCVLQPSSEGVIVGDIVKVEFISGHPRNILDKIIPTFMEVQKQTSSGWETVANDAHWDTKYSWRRTYLASGRATIEWNTSNFQPGFYRIVHYGLAYSPLRGTTKYDGDTNTFALRAAQPNLLRLMGRQV